ncbi:hypothetical protein GW17_00039846 [Ensete ventricosum]|nr:hypothetical protein GW17_00039846 [Ensete ventricosum]
MCRPASSGGFPVSFATGNTGFTGIIPRVGLVYGLEERMLCSLHRSRQVIRIRQTGRVGPFCGSRLLYSYVVRVPKRSFCLKHQSSPPFPLSWLSLLRHQIVLPASLLVAVAVVVIAFPIFFFPLRSDMISSSSSLLPNRKSDLWTQRFIDPFLALLVSLPFVVVGFAS